MDARVPQTYLLDVNDRLTAAGVSADQRRDCLALLGLVNATLATQSLASRERSGDLAARLGLSSASFIAAMKHLANVGAVALGHHAGQRRILITPPGAPAIGRPRQHPAAGEIVSAAMRHIAR